MLVLSRQRDETIMIGDEIEITVVDIRGDKIRLGITAPTRIAVHRKEVYDAISDENEQAARVGGAELSGSDLAALAQTIRPGPHRADAHRRASGLAHQTPIDAVTAIPGPVPAAADPAQPRRETA